MNWNNLKNNCCPKCAWGLRLYLNNYKCISPECDFFIGKNRFNELIGKMYQNPQADFHEVDNARALNNLGHEEVAEDFSDSKFL